MGSVQGVRGLGLSAWVATAFGQQPWSREERLRPGEAMVPPPCVGRRVGGLGLGIGAEAGLVVGKEFVRAEGGM